MQLEFCKVTVPAYLETNVLDCPIKYCLRKHEIKTVLPRSYKLNNCEYIVCVPSLMYVSYMRKMEDTEDFDFKWLKTDNSDINNLDDTFIIKDNNEYILTKAV